MEDALLLGPVRFAAFEVPEWVRFGGRQRLAVHALPGGGRVVDALGGEDGDLAWSGAFSGVDAGLRAQAVDELRRAGAPLLCAWGEWAYQVVIGAFEARAAGPWWVPYRVRLVVLYDASRPPGVVDGALPGVGDGAAAAGYLAPLGLGVGVDVGAALAGAAAGLAGDVGSALGAAGSLAQLGFARGFLMRGEG